MQPGKGGGCLERVSRSERFRLADERFHRGLGFLQCGLGGRHGGLRPLHAGLRLRIFRRGCKLLLGGRDGCLGRLQIAARRRRGEPATIGLRVCNAGRGGIDAADPRGERASRLGVPRGQFRGDQLLGSQPRIQDGHPEGLEGKRSGGHLQGRAGIGDQQLERFLPRIDGELLGFPVAIVPPLQFPHAVHHDRSADGIGIPDDGKLEDRHVDGIPLHP